MPKQLMGLNVYEAAKERIRENYRAGDRCVLSFSGGKDSGVLLELLIEVAREFNALPVDVVMRDEEIMYPGTFEYCERVMNRPEVNMKWLIMGQPIINAFNRFSPYWWVFDPAERDKWVRQPPEWAIWRDSQCIESMTSRDLFPTQAGQRLIAMIGLRANESKARTFAIYSSEGYMTKRPNDWDVYNSRPIYDWKDTDVWKAIHDFGWDYNHAYDGLRRAGARVAQLRIAPPSMRQGMDQLKIGMKIWPPMVRQGLGQTPGDKGGGAIREIRVGADPSNR